MNVLIVEDDKETLDFLKDFLKAEGFVVDATEDGEDGSYKAKVNAYDIVILDIGLPRKDGRQIAAELRADGKTMPILILSIKGEIGTKAELLDIGADDYVVKPFSFIELLARVRALLRRPKRIEGEVLQIDDLVLDVRKRIVVRGKKQIHLSPKEFFLLEYFLRNEGKVLSRVEILEHVWDMNADLFTNTVETHIVNLRRKLQQKNQRELIHTVSGTGYKLC